MSTASDSAAAMTIEWYEKRCQWYQARVAALEAEIGELRKQIAIMDLSTPLEEDLSARIDEMCRYLAMEDGFTLAGIARLLSECQRRMADDWRIVGNERRERARLEAENQHLRAQLEARLAAEAPSPSQ